MSETLWEGGKIVLGAMTGPASLGSARALLQVTIRDGSDYAQLNREEVVEVLETMQNWLEDTGSLA